MDSIGVAVPKLCINLVLFLLTISNKTKQIFIFSGQVYASIGTDCMHQCKNGAGLLRMYVKLFYLLILINSLQNLSKICLIHL